MAQKITSDNLQALIATGKPVVLDFWATWCGPCRMVAPVIEALATEYDGRAIVGKCDIEEDENLPAQYGVRNIPTILFIKDGQVVDKQVGAASRQILEEKLKAIL
ncbi:MAG: thioredoxin [Bacteroidaceae bacterium]|jgi:thioredoxin 1|nr:thioredoxin [Bacteroidaceae bacterium]MBQ7988341.1 thioredoxin [Bacteroidaceae bacterium]